MPSIEYCLYLSAQIIIFLSMVQSQAKSPLKLDLDPIFLSRELLFQGTINSDQ